MTWILSDWRGHTPEYLVSSDGLVWVTVGHFTTKILCWYLSNLYSIPINFFLCVTLNCDDTKSKGKTSFQMQDEFS
jgi:hypothetical protein